MNFKLNKIILFMLPLVLTLSCVFVFRLATNELGTKWGYLTGFLFYWIVWCIILPFLLLGSNAITCFFRPSLVFDYKIVLCLLGLLIFVYLYAFPKVLKEANTIIILVSFIMAFLNATLEEVLWRLTYLRTFSNPWISIGYASFGFALWHYARK